VQGENFVFCDFAWFRLSGKTGPPHGDWTSQDGNSLFGRPAIQPGGSSDFLVPRGLGESALALFSWSRPVTAIGNGVGGRSSPVLSNRTDPGKVWIAAQLGCQEERRESLTLDKIDTAAHIRNQLQVVLVFQEVMCQPVAIPA